MSELTPGHMLGEYPLIEVHISMPEAEAAREMATELVRRQLAACVQILGPMASIYTWRGEPQQATEWLLLVKSTADRFEELTEAAQRIHAESGAIVLAKGGVHLPGDEAIDVYVDDERTEVLRAPKIGDGVQVAGAGCTLAAAVAAQLALGASPFEAAQKAKEFVTRGIEGRLRSEAPFDVVWQGA